MFLVFVLRLSCLELHNVPTGRTNNDMQAIKETNV